MALVLRSLLASGDVQRIAEYITEQSQSIASGKRFLHTLDKKLAFLGAHPLAGKARPDLGKDVRVFPLGSYLIFYRPMDGGIEVLRIVHGARDVPMVFWSQQP